MTFPRLESLAHPEVVVEAKTSVALHQLAVRRRTERGAGACWALSLQRGRDSATKPSQLCWARGCAAQTRLTSRRRAKPAAASTRPTAEWATRRRLQAAPDGAVKGGRLVLHICCLGLAGRSRCLISLSELSEELTVPHVMLL